MTKLAVFDLDHTLLAADSDYLWGQFLVEQKQVDGEDYERKNRRFYEEYMAGTLDMNAFAQFSMAPLVVIEPSALQRLRRQFVQEKIVPAIAAGAPALLQRHREAGDTLLITTATNRFITQPIAALLGIDHLLATEAEMLDGRYTGRIAGNANFREGKVVHLRQWMEHHLREPAHLTCYSDSQNDLPLLEFADSPVAVDPDPTLRAEAARRGWPIISLR